MVGNAVTEKDWNDVWLSEGFATYFTLLFIEHAYGRDAFAAGLRDSRKTVIDFYAKRPDYRVIHENLDDMSQVTTSMTYQKGSWVLHTCCGSGWGRSILGGDPGVSCALPRRERVHGRLSSRDGRAAGEDLSAFFRQVAALRSAFRGWRDVAGCQGARGGGRGAPGAGRRS
ncbi:MAG: hypothetical protein IPK33_11045 [Gemmatimonadetes bacterium]|nr:hypothetical protein [Gemmatimonadota bacterium]